MVLLLAFRLDNQFALARSSAISVQPAQHRITCTSKFTHKVALL
jgi:hypothetical protein